MVTKRSPVENVSEETFIKRLKSLNLGKTKQQLVEYLFKAYYSATNYHFYMKNLEFTALNEEIKFYRGCYQLQKSYIESVMNSFKEKYQEFTRDLEFNLKETLKNLIDKFWLMKNESTEENLKEFLSYFKASSIKIEDVLKNFDQLPQNDLIKLTFEQILIQLDGQVVDMNKNLMKKINNLNAEMSTTKELSNQSDYLFNEVLKITLENESLDSTKMTIFNNDDENENDFK